ncbi:DUF535 domain-containing protein [Cronobacter muytjensii]|nr:DUF535 domain-containing protein [Cronobacter muytjensii]
MTENLMINLSVTPWKLCLSLFTGNLTPHQLWADNKFRVKFILRSLVMPFSTRRLLKFIVEHPYSAKLLIAQPRLPCRVHRPYLSTSLKRHEAASAIVYHYNFIHDLMGSSIFMLHLSEGICIAEFEGKSLTGYYIQFVSTYKLDREGEASLILRSRSGEMLCAMTFTIYEKSSRRVLMIGGLQGPGGRNAQEKIHLATKDLHGLFPKKIVYEALITLSKMFRIESIYAVSNETHVYHSLRYLNRKRLMHADYSAFWQMVGGTLTNDGNYELKCDSVRKDIDAIPSKKRSEYRRRYELLDELNNAIKTNPYLPETE